MIRVVCTGKGAHREFRFVRTLFVIDPDLEIAPEWGGGVCGEWKEVGFRPLQKAYTFTCPRCGRNIRRLKGKTLSAALDGLHAKGATTLDISHLPF